MFENTKNGFEARIIGIVTSANRKDPEAWKALAECDIAEFRADLWEPSRIVEEARAFREECIRAFGHPLETIFTLRLQRDGGAWPDVLAAEREKIWLALELDGDGALCDWIDLEVESIPSLSAALRKSIAARHVKVLASHHNFAGSYSPPELSRLGRELKATGADAVKLAVLCRDRAQLLDLLAFARETAAAVSVSGGSACVLSMGELGKASRVLGPWLGCALTYGYLSGGAVAPGQLSVRQLREFYAKSSADAPAELSVSRLLDWAQARLPGDSDAD